MALASRRSRVGTPRLVVLTSVLALIAAVLTFSGSAAAELNDCWDDTARPVEKLEIASKVTRNNRTTVKLTWQAPPDAGWLESYRVAYTADWRPQKYLVLETSETSATVSGLWPGRLYTIYVQPEGSDPDCDDVGDIVFGDSWGTPASVEVRTANTPLYNSEVEWVVSLGDSFISGEGGRWAGNADFQPNLRNEIDTGERTYFDYASGEMIEGCHRSRSAMIHITVAKSMNFACSGAITTSTYDSSPNASTEGDDPELWKPGVDRAVFPNVELPFEGQEAIGQAEMLARFARTHTVKMVVLSIGGNNFYFSDIVTTCVKGFLGASRCSANERLAEYMSETWQSKVRAEVKTAIQEVVWAMRSAGYDESQWTLVQTFYPKPIATSDLMRYPETKGLNLEYRQTAGGCGMRDVDADWAINTVLRTVNETISEAALQAKAYFNNRLRLVQMNNADAFSGHELCHREVKRVNSRNPEDRGGVRSWGAKDAPDRSEWMKEIDVSNFSAATKNESFHPGYWGQLALRNCLRQVWNSGTVTSGGTCTPLNGRNKYGEPNMQFVGDARYTHLP
jgi:hypothetical protein